MQLIWRYWNSNLGRPIKLRLKLEYLTGIYPQKCSFAEHANVFAFIFFRWNSVFERSRTFFVKYIRLSASHCSASPCICQSRWFLWSFHSAYNISYLSTLYFFLTSLPLDLFLLIFLPIFFSLYVEMPLSKDTEPHFNAF